MGTDLKPLIIFGAGETAELAYEYFTQDSPYEVVAFSIDRAYFNEDQFNGLPVVPFDEVTEKYPPSNYCFFVALSSINLNRPRRQKYLEVKDLGYHLASYISSRAQVWRTVTIGENCLVACGTVIQHGAEIGDNVIMLGTLNQIAHRAKIGSHTYITASVSVAGYTEIGSSCFLGLGCKIINDIKIADDCYVVAGALIVRDTDFATMQKGHPARPDPITTHEYFNLEE